MTAMADELTPSDGISDVWIELDGFDRHSNSPNATVRFRIVERQRGKEVILATVPFRVEAADDGLSGMIARAYDDLIAMLRQGLFAVDKMRAHYRSEVTRKSRG
jgi:hypothetical protein